MLVAAFSLEIPDHPANPARLEECAPRRLVACLVAARNEQDLGRVLEELREFHRQYDRLERLLTRLSDEWVS